MVCWTVHPPSGNDSFLSLALTGLRLQALDLSLHLLPFCFNFYLFPSSSAFTPFFAYLCLSPSGLGPGPRKLGNCRCNTRIGGRGIPPSVTRGHHEARRTLRLCLNYMIKSALISYIDET